MRPSIALRQRLAELGLGHHPSWIFADERVEKLRYTIDRSWRGELPRTYLFDAQGRVEVVTGRVEARWLEEWLARRARRGGAGQGPAPVSHEFRGAVRHCAWPGLREALRLGSPRALSLDFAA